MPAPEILVADDEPHIVRSLSFVLRKAGFEVIEARDGQEAMDCIQNQRPCLVFLDIMMPVCDGYEICRKVRSDPELKDTRIVFLTALGQDTDRETGMKCGGDFYLTKPFSPSEAVRLANQIVRKEQDDTEAT